MVKPGRQFKSTSTPPSKGGPSESLDACDDAERLRDVFHAYSGLGKPVSPFVADDSDEVHPCKTELGALLRLPNRELQRRIDRVSHSAIALRHAIDLDELAKATGSRSER